MCGGDAAGGVCGVYRVDRKVRVCVCGGRPEKGRKEGEGSMRRQEKGREGKGRLRV